MDWKATALVLIAGLARSETQEAPKAARLAEHVVVRRYALVVGVETTKKAGVGRLEFAKKDAIDIAELLRTAGYVTRVLAAQEGDARNDPTLDMVITEMKRLLDAAGAGDLVLFYFSGHGFMQGEESYLCLRDTMSAESALAVTDLASKLTRGKARKQVILIDACRTPLGSKSTAAPLRMRLESTIGRAVLFSSAEGLPSWEPDADERKQGIQNGVFTHFLLRALRGEAEPPGGDHLLTINEIGAFLHEELRTHSLTRGRDLPVTSRWEGDAGGDILVRELDAESARPVSPGSSAIAVRFEPPLTGTESRSALDLVEWLENEAGFDVANEEEDAVLTAVFSVNKAEKQKNGGYVCSGWPTLIVLSRMNGTPGPAQATPRASLLRGPLSKETPNAIRREAEDARCQVLIRGLEALLASPELRKQVVDTIRDELSSKKN